MTTLEDELAAAIAKARRDLAPLIKEWDEDAHPRGEGGRFGSGGGKDIAKIDRASQRALDGAESHRDSIDKDEVTKDDAALGHTFAAEDHRDVASDLRELAGSNPKESEALRAAADLHDKAAAAHDKAADKHSNNPWDEASSMSGPSYDAAEASDKAERATGEVAQRMYAASKSLTTLTDQLAAAIAKARADAAPLLKEQERDERGRFAGGGGAEAAAEGRFGDARAAHAAAEAAHRDAAAAIRQEGGDKSLALKHEQAARAHDAARLKNGSAMYAPAARSVKTKRDAVRASTRADELTSELTKE